jgi:hypothetical protein
MSVGEAQAALGAAEGIDLNTLITGLSGMQCVAIVIGGEVIPLGQEEALSEGQEQ